MQGAVAAVIPAELRGRAVLDDPARVEDENAVGHLDGGKAMGDDERGSSPQQRAERALDEALRRQVERGRRLVEDQDPRVGQKGAREGDQLALP